MSCDQCPVNTNFTCDGGCNLQLVSYTPAHGLDAQWHASLPRPTQVVQHNELFKTACFALRSSGGPLCPSDALRTVEWSTYQPVAPGERLPRQPLDIGLLYRTFPVSNDPNETSCIEQAGAGQRFALATRCPSRSCAAGTGKCMKLSQQPCVPNSSALCVALCKDLSHRSFEAGRQTDRHADWQACGLASMMVTDCAPMEWSARQTCRHA